jgi:thioredoxin-dependent peroxiredoxin
MKGQPLTLSGDSVEPGDMAPDCQLVGKDLQPVKLSSFLGKVCVISCMPSLDTPVCDIMARRFSKDVVSLGKDVVLLAITMDLPFAQGRWCAAANVENVHALSDHRDCAFGRGFGVLIKDLRLLARAVFVVDKKGIVRYKQIVPELTHEPDYAAALQAAKQLL